MSDGSIKIAGKSYSRGELARLSGLSLSHVSRIWKGERSPSLKVLKQIACAVQVELQYVVQSLPSIPPTSTPSDSASE